MVVDVDLAVVRRKRVSEAGRDTLQADDSERHQHGVADLIAGSAELLCHWDVGKYCARIAGCGVEGNVDEVLVLLVDPLGCGQRLDEAVIGGRDRRSFLEERRVSTPGHGIHLALQSNRNSARSSTEALTWLNARRSALSPHAAGARNRRIDNSPGTRHP